ncbi:MAG: O-antigen ligase family protein [Candidatus Aminicenantes bacterium]|nr:O-antigen ligase family protein [Candidatus Aminicenantes bacterium]
MLNYTVSGVKYLFFLRLVYFLLLFLVAAFLSRFRLQAILAPLSGGIALIVFVYGFIQKFFLFPWILKQSGWDMSPYAAALRTQVASGRIFAIFPLPTLYAMVCGLLLIFVTHYFFKANGWRKGYWALLFLLGVANLFFTQSFGGIIFFTVGMLFYLFISGIFKIKYLAPLLMVLALLFSLVLAMRFSEARQLKPVKLRFDNWLQAGRIIAQAPLLGVGLGNYETAVPAHVYPGEPASIYAHNFFLQLTAEIGVPWLILLLLLAVPWLKDNGRQLLQRENALFTALAILILLFNLFDVGNYFFAAGIGFAVACSQLSDLGGRKRGLYFWPAAVLAIVLLVNEIGVDRQKTADLWLVRGEFGRAEGCCRQALRINPLSYRSWLGMAAIAQKKGDSEAAERSYGKILEIYPGQAYANFMFSHAAFRRNAYLTALLYAGRAAAANKKNHEYQRWHEYIKTHLADRIPLSGN